MLHGWGDPGRAVSSAMISWPMRGWFRDHAICIRYHNQSTHNTWHLWAGQLATSISGQYNQFSFAACVGVGLYLPRIRYIYHVITPAPFTFSCLAREVSGLRKHWEGTYTQPITVFNLLYSQISNQHIQRDSRETKIESQAQALSFIHYYLNILCICC